MRNVNWLWSTIGLTTQELSNLSQTLEANLGLNSPRKLLAEAERELALVEERLQDVYVGHMDPKLGYILGK